MLNVHTNIMMNFKFNSNQQNKPGTVKFAPYKLPMYM